MAFVPLSVQNQSAGPEQGTEEWFEGRKHKMTGSKPSSIMFDCTDEAAYNKLHAQIFGDAPRDPVDESQQAAMDWGSEKEEVACAQFIKEMPGTVVFECSQIEHPTYDWMAASPDGYIVRLAHENGTIKNPHEVVERAAFEIKCPGSRLRDAEGKPMPDAMMKSLSKKKNPPYYYLTQVHFEMVMLGAPVTYFYMWTPWYSKVWKIHFDKVYWSETVATLKAFKEKNIPFPQLKAKIDAWKAMSQAICRKILPLQTFKHAPEGALEEVIEKSTTSKVVGNVVSPDNVVKFSWYKQRDLDLLTKMFE